jgi:hypothetical protein
VRGGVGCVRGCDGCVRGCGGRGGSDCCTHTLQLMFLGNRSRLLAQANKGLRKTIAKVVHNNFWIFIFYLPFCLFSQVISRTIAIQTILYSDRPIYSYLLDVEVLHNSFNLIIDL